MTWCFLWSHPDISKKAFCNKLDEVNTLDEISMFHMFHLQYVFLFLLFEQAR